MSSKRLSLAVTCACFAVLAASGCSATFGQVRMPGEMARADRAKSQSEATPTADLPGFSEDEKLRIALVQPIVAREAAAQGLDPELVNAVIWVESRFRPEAKSPAGARGLMQLMPATAAHLAKQLGERRPKAHDPEFNIRAGAYYLGRLFERFDGDETLAIAAYNAGPGNVAKWQAQGQPLPEYSQSYVSKVLEARARFGQHGADPSTDAPMMESDTEIATPAARESVFATSAQPSGGVVPEAALTQAEPAPAEAPAFEEEDFEPFFAPAPELDREVAPQAPAHPLAVTEARGRWPGADPRPSVPAKPEAPASTDVSDLPAPTVPEVGPGVLPDLDAPSSAP